MSSAAKAIEQAEPVPGNASASSALDTGSSAPLPPGSPSGSRQMSEAIVPLEDRLLTADDVAELLRLPVSTVYDLARTGRLPHLRIGRALRFSRGDLEAHLAERCRGHVSARA